MIQVTFAGNLVRDPETKQGKNSPFTSFSVAATHQAKDGQDGKLGTEFIECAAGGKTGENIAKYFHKGDQIIVYGRLLRTNAWVGKKDNKPHGALSISVDNFDFGAKKGGASGNGTAAPAAAPASEIGDDEIPF